MNGMNRGWTFGRKMALGYVVLVAFSVLIGVTAILALRTAVAAKDEVIGVYAQILLDDRPSQLFETPGPTELVVQRTQEG